MKSLLALALLLVLPASAPAEDSFGFSRVPISLNSDNFIPVPYAKTPLWIGTLSADASVTGNLATFTLPDCPIPTVPCYLRFRSGPLAGRYYHTASGSTEGSIIVDTNGDNQAALAVEGDEAALIPFWTLAEFLPIGGFDFVAPRPSAQQTEICYYNGNYVGPFTAIHQHGNGTRLPTNTGAPCYSPSGSHAIYNEVYYGYTAAEVTTPILSLLFPNHQGSGTNLPLVDQVWPYAHVTSVYVDVPAEYNNWTESHTIESTISWTNSNGTILDSKIIPPDGFVVLRMGTPGITASALPDGYHVVLSGYNEPGPLVTTMATLSTGSQDNYLSIPIVRPTTLAQLVQGEGFWESPNTGGGLRKDQLLVFWPGSTGFNRSPQATLFKVTNQGWKNQANVAVSADNTAIPPHTVFMLRKKTTPDGATSFLKVNPSN